MAVLQAREPRHDQGITPLALADYGYDYDIDWAGPHFLHGFGSR